jgi:cellulose synthase/poly-beta-1,6-N-acetylglucosamine synthase-like glycosyltransferase
MTLQILWLAAYTTVTVGLTAYGVHRLWLVYLFWRHRHDRIAPEAAFESPPLVTVQLPVYNEQYVIERLLDAVAEIDYPADRLEVQILDDSTDATTDLIRDYLPKLEARGLRVFHLHRTDRTGFKAGALAAGMKTARGEFIAIFDADFVPPRNILRETIDFFTDPEVGMIQTRWGHLNRNHNLLTRVQALLLDGHLLIEQTARHRSGRFFNFNGTAGLWRTSCIVDAGGWKADTLTEDLDLSYRAQLKGWRFVFLPDLVTPAELPVEIHALKAQQHRWTKGAVQTCRKILAAVWRSRLPLAVKIESTLHLGSNFAYLLLALMCFLLQPNWTMAEVEWTSLLLVHLPVFFMATGSLFVFYGLVLRHAGVALWKIPVYIPLLICVGIGLCINNAKAVLEALCDYRSEFVRTPKYGVTEKVRTWRHRSYFSARSMVMVLEIALALYYAYFVVFAWEHRLWVSLPFLVLFLVGFAYVSFLSVFQRWKPSVLWAGGAAAIGWEPDKG